MARPEGGSWRWIRGLWRRVAGVSIRYKLLGVVLGVVALLGLTMTLQVQSQLAGHLQQSLEERGLALARDLAEDAADLILTQNFFGLYQKLRYTLETNSDVRYIFIVSPHGEVLAHSFPSRVPLDLLSVNSLSPDQPWRVQILNSDEGLLTDVAVPILGGRLGVVRLGLSHQRLQDAVLTATFRLVATTILALLVGGAAALLLTRILSGPILELVDAVRAAGRGDLSRRPPVRMEDEIGELTAAFNAMMDDLIRFQTELLHQNKELWILNTVARALSEARSLQEILEIALQSTLDVLGCPAGWIILQLDESSAPILAAQRGLSRDFADHLVESGKSVCPCVQAILHQEEWTRPVSRSQCPVLRWAQETGSPEARFQHHLSVALMSRDRILGVLNVMLSGQEDAGALADGEGAMGLPGEDARIPRLIRLMEAIGRQVGVALDAELQRQRLMVEMKKREALRSQLLERILTAQEEERHRIARELHDEAGQALTSLRVGLGLLEREAHQPELVLARVAELKRLAEEILENLHRLAMDLRPAILDHLGLVAALRQYVELCQRRYGLKVQFEVIGLEEERLSPAVEITLYRIVQEALTNVVRHAQATRVDVLLERRGDHIVAIVEDNGIGFDPEHAMRDGRLGLFGIRERVERLGGTLILESAPGSGTTVVVEVPYAHPDPDSG
ncbi:Oxygen sensor histidine kinase NreB [Candidatus Thermoflexus japonica]|uniref:Oxygen sensor histidine kinase NreB n=1 Tax=Candidatus Thermoflexus japonica TaxID=2035417 RepID=A0A2H5Y9I9_9CHLR|nr:Oxygen sensor histidine kinase NreB [Candidatus Thermoflexus japonica]